MVDQSKRTMLKGVAGLGVGTVAMATSASALAEFAQEASGAAPHGVSLDLAQIQVATRVSSKHNDIEVVLTNTGSSVTNITDMTPAEINTVRGRFDFNALLANGSIKLEAGESVSVPMQRHAVILEAGALANRTSDLQAAIKQRLSITTDDDSLAVIDFKSLAQFA